MAGEATVVITAEDRASATLNAVKLAVGGVATAAAAATAVVGVVAGVISNAVREADALNDFSQRLGMSVQALGAYKLAAEQSGASLEAVGRGVKSMSVAMQNHGEVLKKAGIDSKDSDKAFRQLADVFAKMPDGMDKAALAVKLFGREGMALIPLLNQGSKGLAEAAENSRLYGESMAKLAPEADQFNDRLTEAKLAIGDWGRIIAAEVLPAVNVFAQALLDVNKDSGGLRDTLKSLADDGSIKRWADEAALVAAKVVGAFRDINTYAEVVNLRLLQGQAFLGRMARAATLATGPIGLVVNREEIAKTLTELNGFVDQSNAEINTKLASVGQLTDRVRAGLADPWRGWTAKQKEYAEQAAATLAANAEKPLAAQRKAMDDLAKAFYDDGRGRALIDALGKPGAGGQADALLRAQYSTRLAAIKEGLAAEELALKTARAGELVTERQYIEQLAELKTAAAQQQELVLAEQYGKAKSPVDRQRIVTEMQKAAADYGKAVAEAELALVKLGEKGDEAIRNLSLALGKTTLEPLEQAAAAFAQRYGKLINDAVAAGKTDEVAPVAEALWLQIADEKRFEAARKQYDELFAEMSAGIESVRAAAAQDGGLLAQLGSDQQVKTLIDSYKTQLSDLRAQLDEFTRGDPTRLKYIADTGRQINRVIADSGREAKKFGDEINQALTDSLYRSFESGKGFSESFFDSLEASAKSLVLKVAVQAIIDASGIKGLVTSLVGGVLGGAGGGASALGTAGNLVSTGGGLYQAYTGFTTGAGTGAWGAAGNWAGNTTVGGYLGGYGANTAATYGTTVGSQQTAMLAAQDSAFAGSSALGGAATALGWMAVAYMALEYLDSKEGGVKTEGDSFATLGADSLTRGTSWVDGSPWYALGANKPQMFNLGAGVNEGDPLMTDVPGSLPANEVIAGMLEPWTEGVREMLADLGGSAVGMSFGLGFNTDPAGTAPDNVSAGVADAAGNSVYRQTYDVDRGTANASLSLELQRMMLAAVKAADVSALYKDMLAEVDIQTLAADQIANIMTSMATLKQMADAFEDAFGKDLTTAVLKALGGMEAMDATLTAYGAAVYTDEERRQRQIEAVRDRFAALDVAMPASVAQFRALVDAQDLSTAAGQDLFAALVKLAPAFAAATEALAATVDAALDGVGRAVTAEKNRLNATYQDALDALDDSIGTVGDSISTLGDLSAALKSALAGITAEAPLTLAARWQAQAEVQAALAIAKAGGSLPTAEGLSGSLATLARPAGDLYATRVDYLRDQARANSALAGLAELTDGQLSVAERSLKALEAQRDQLGQLHDDQVAALDRQLAAAQEQVDALKGIDKSVLSVAAAIEKLNAALTGAKKPATGGTAAPTSGGGAVVGPVGDAPTAARAEFSRQYNLLGTPYRVEVTDAAEIDRLRDIRTYVQANYDANSADSVRSIADAAAQYGVTQADIATALGVDPETVRKTFAGAGVPAFAAGGWHTGGLRVVGEDGPELESTGPARIFSNTQLRGLFSGGDMAAELKALRAELAAFRAANSAEGRAIAAATYKTALLLDRVMPDGDALATRAAA